MKSIILTVILLAASFSTRAQTIAIMNAEMHPISGPPIENGTLIIENGLISALGRDVSIPADARVIDGTGLVVTPGFIDSNSRRIGVEELGRGDAGSSDATTSDRDLGPSFSLVHAVNPDNSHIPIVRLRGVSAVMVRPGGSNMFFGQGTLISMTGTRVEDMLRRETAAQYTALGESGSAQAGGSRAAAYQRIHDALWDARAMVLSPDEEDSVVTKPTTPQRKGDRSDLKAADLEALKRVIEGEVPLVVSANRVSDMRAALELGNEFGIRLVVEGGVEAWRIADELAAADAAVVVTPSNNIPTFDGLSATLGNAGILSAAGVEVLLTGSAFGGSRSLSHEAGVAVANGMNHTAALRALTLGAAEVWGVAGTMGSLDEGKIADVVVWSGDPLELSTSVRNVFIGGVEIEDDSRQERLFERYRDLDRYRRIGSR